MLGTLSTKTCEYAEDKNPMLQCQISFTNLLTAENSAEEILAFANTCDFN